MKPWLERRAEAMREHQRFLKLPKSAREAIEQLRQDQQDAEARASRRKGYLNAHLNDRPKRSSCYCGHCARCKHRKNIRRYRQIRHDQAMASSELESRRFTTGWMFGWYEVAGKYFQVKSQLSGLMECRLKFPVRTAELQTIPPWRGRQVAQKL